MRKITFAGMLIATTLSPISAYAVDGTINFTGTILNAACTVDPGSVTQTVSLGTVNKAEFVNAGDAVSSGPITITVGDCDPAVTRVAVRFDGPLAAGNTELLGLTSGGAAGVGIGIYEADGSTLVPLGTKSAGITAPATAATADMNFVAKYVATAANAGITAGVANAVATFTLDYN